MSGEPRATFMRLLRRSWDSGEMHSADEIRGDLTLADVMYGTQMPRLLFGWRRRTAYREGASDVRPRA